MKFLLCKLLAPVLSSKIALSDSFQAQEKYVKNFLPSSTTMKCEMCFMFSGDMNTNVWAKSYLNTISVGSEAKELTLIKYVCTTWSL